jgi:hypothetical protein
MNNKFDGIFPRIPVHSMIVSRDYSYTQQQDYDINVLPYLKNGYRIEPVGEHRYGTFVLTGWRLYGNGSNRVQV